MNKRLTFCPICGNPAEEIVVGEVYKYVTDAGEVIGYGHPGGEPGLSLHAEGAKYNVVELGEYDRAPASKPCGKCLKLIAAQRLGFGEEVKRGGVYWMCEECGLHGVVIAKDSRGFSAQARASVGIKPPNKVRVKFRRCEDHDSEEEHRELMH